jgi:Spy/CpxP family protein refolding chaperone
MFGYAFAVACLAALFVVQRRGHHHGHRHRHHRRGPWRAIDARPEQRDALAGVMRELRDELEPMREILGRSRSAVAEALRGDDPAPAAVDATFEMHKEALDAAQRALGDAFAKVHAILDPEQRERLAKMIERSGRHCGPRFAFGPYR